jgi:hypothetical protein
VFAIVFDLTSFLDLHFILIAEVFIDLPLLFFSILEILTEIIFVPAKPRYSLGLKKDIGMCTSGKAGVRCAAYVPLFFECILWQRFFVENE